MRKYLIKLKLLFLMLTLVFATSCNNQPKLPEIPGIKGPLFNLSNGQVILTVKLLKANISIGTKLPIPKTNNSFVEVAPNVEDGGSMIVFYLDVEDLKTLDIGIGEGNTLPDGRPIPGIPGGTLEGSLRADTELMDLSFYFHKKLFGFFIPLGWDTNGLGGYWNVMIDNKNIGMLGAVASDGQGHGAGLLFFLRLEQLKNKRLQKMIRLSKQNPHLIF